MPTPPATPDLAAITGRQRQTWATGDFNVVALTIMPVSEDLCAAVDPHPGQRVLDVACGSGNAALVAARRHCDVTGVDYVPALLDRARQRAAAEGSTIEFREADAQALPFADGAFDVVLSTFGVMFAPDQEKAAAELLRVCRPGGRIGLANWNHEGFSHDFFQIVTKYMTPPAGLNPPHRWGTDQGLRELLGAGTSSITTVRRTVTQYYRSPGHQLDIFLNHFGPTRRAFELADAAGRASLRQDLGTVFAKHNRATDGTVAMECEYLQVVAIRR